MEMKLQSIQPHAKDVMPTYYTTLALACEARTATVMKWLPTECYWIPLFLIRKLRLAVGMDHHLI